MNEKTKKNFVAAKVARKNAYLSGGYWQRRMDMIYYQYIDYILRTVAVQAESLIDVGSGNCPYLELFDWIPDRLSVDIRVPYKSKTVTGLRCDIMQTHFIQHFDVCTCFQVLEHVPKADMFAKRLLDLAPIVVVSVPYKWPKGSAKGHLHDPIDYEKLTEWMEREANYKIVVSEPFAGKKGRRLFAIYNVDQSVRYDHKAKKDRIIRNPLDRYGT